MTITYTATITFGPTNSTLTQTKLSVKDIANLSHSLSRDQPNAVFMYRVAEDNSTFVLPARQITAFTYKAEHPGPVTWEEREITTGTGHATPIAVAIPKETQ